MLTAGSGECLSHNIIYIPCLGRQLCNREKMYRGLSLLIIIFQWKSLNVFHS